MDRREFMRGVTGVGAVAGLTACVPSAEVPTVPFPQGVAAGLHSDDAIVLWTRVEPTIAPVTSVTWIVATDAAMSTVVATGSSPVSAAADHTVKVLVEGLDPYQSYWYRFTAGDRPSPIGRAATLPAPDAEPRSLRLAFASCQSFATGYYGAWRDVAARDVDAVVFLGDYIYESPAIQLLRPLRSEPLTECITLDQYREKYRHYRTDPDLQAAHAAHPWTVVWDDHEVHNDWDRSVYSAEPGRFDDAAQAWFEYQPVWPVDGTRIHKSLRWGRLGELFMLDSRQHRDPGLDVPLVFGAGLLGPEAADPMRTMLGTGQRGWLLDGLSEAEDDDVRWKLVGSPQPIGPMRMLDLDSPETRQLSSDLPRHAGLYMGFGGWDGFPAERDTILEHLRADGIGGAAFLSGDVHSFWAGALRSDFDDPASPVVAHDFAGGAISSPPGGPHTLLAEGGTTMTPSWDFVDGVNNGYGLLTCTADTATVTFMGLDGRYPGTRASAIYVRTIT